MKYVKKISCHKKIGYFIFPRILIILLKRFDFKNEINKYFKLNNYFEFPFSLNLNKLLNINNSENNLSNIDY